METESEKKKIIERYIEELSNSDLDCSHEIKRAINRINYQLLSRNLTITDIKKDCRIQSNSFSALFKLYVGNYPHKYVLKHRIKLSKKLLKLKKLTIVEIGLEVGFNSHSTYSKAFKRIVGVTPSKYRSDMLKQN